MVTDLTLRRIAIGVRSLEQARGLYEALFGGEFAPSDSSIMEGVRCLALTPAGGGPSIELVEPRHDESPLARFIRKRGEGIHHLSLGTPDLDAVVTRLEKEGARLVRTGSYYRAEGGGALEEVFLHPKDANGVLFHLVEET
jgi:methylmalonyl-CoA/ethylmalonyl-CoA epimerase